MTSPTHVHALRSRRTRHAVRERLRARGPPACLRPLAARSHKTLGPRHDRRVHHRAVDDHHAVLGVRQDALGPRRPPLALGPIAALTAGDLPGMDAQLAPEAQLTAVGHDRVSRAASSSSRVDTPSTGAARPATALASTRLPRACDKRRLGRGVDPEGGCEVDVAERQASHRSTGGQCLRRQRHPAASPRDRRSANPPTWSLHTSYVIDAFRLGQHHRRRRCRAARGARRRSTECRRRSRARGNRRATTAQSTTARPRGFLVAAGATASSRSRMTMSAPEASAFAKRSGRLPGTNRKLRAVSTAARLEDSASRCTHPESGSRGHAAVLAVGAGSHERTGRHGAETRNQCHL